MSQIPVTIDAEACTGCGLCVQCCPSWTLSMGQDKAAVTGERCIVCEHCASICPVGAVRMDGVDREQERFASFTYAPKYIAPGNFSCSELVNLMRSRRSCRGYKEDAVPREVLEDLVKAGITAPSGTNSQRWTFTILPTRNAVTALAMDIKGFFERINRMAGNPLLRKGLKLLGQGDLQDYYEEYYGAVCSALEEWETQGRDRLFHGAPAAILVGAAPGASCPAEDALLASQNIQLAAHCLGLGTCLIGYAVAAMDNDKKIQQTLNIPKDEKIYAVLTIGRPAEPYQRLTGRKTPRVRIVG